MSNKDPDDIFGPGDDEDFHRRPVIDVTPEKRKKGEIDIDSDKNILAQLLEDHDLDRTDKRPGADNLAMVIAIFIFLLIIILVIKHLW